MPKYLFNIMLPFFLIISIFPRNKRIWVYAEGPTNSVLPLLRYARKKDAKKHVYITKFDTQIDKLKSEGIFVLRQNSFLGCYYIARARVHIICRRTLEDVNKRLSHGALIVNLFHGMLRPFICSATEANIGKPKWKINKNKLKMKRRYDRYLLLSSSSELTQKLQSEHFLRNDSSTLPIVGIPRLDRLYSKQTDREYITKNISSSMKEFDKIFAYMPTGREYKLNNVIDFKKINEFLLSNNSALIIRAHRLDRNFIHLDKGYSNIYRSTLYHQDWSDAIDELSGVDFLISDHSSIMHEFLITGRPILSYFPDWERLIEVGKIETNFELELPSKKITNFNGLLASMDSVLQGKYSYKRYNEIANKYHFYKDGNSSQRVYKYIIDNASGI
jgi:CDP-glycerol glycerophosphotransferase (TagB/SpsB family)